MNPLRTPISGKNSDKIQEEWLNQQMEQLGRHSCPEAISNQWLTKNNNTGQDLNDVGLVNKECQGDDLFDIGNLTMQSTILKPGNAKNNIMFESLKPGQNKAIYESQIYVAEGEYKQIQIGVPVSRNQQKYDDDIDQFQSTTSSMIKVTKKNKIKVPGLFSDENSMESYDMQSNFVQGKICIDQKVRVPRIMEPVNGARSRAKTPRPSPKNRYGIGKKLV